MITKRWTKRKMDLLIIEHMGIVEKQAVGFYLRLNGSKLPVNQDDMIATAYLALTISARKWEPHLGSRFGAYASKSVHHALIDMVKAYEVAPGCTICPLNEW